MDRIQLAFVLALLSGCGVTGNDGTGSSAGATAGSSTGGGASSAATSSSSTGASSTGSCGAQGTSSTGSSTSGGGDAVDAGPLDAGAGEPDAGPGYATCHGSCSDPAGTVQALPTVEGLYAAMEGKWLFCGDRSFFGSGPADAIGVEYGPASSAPTQGGGTVGGDMYYLVQGPNGPERGAGFAYQLTYDISGYAPGPFQLNMHPAPNAGFAGSARYSPCPEQFEFNGYSTAILNRL